MNTISYHPPKTRVITMHENKAVWCEITGVHFADSGESTCLNYNLKTLDRENTTHITRTAGEVFETREALINSL